MENRHITERNFREVRNFQSLKKRHSMKDKANKNFKKALIEQLFLQKIEHKLLKPKNHVLLKAAHL